MGYTRQGPYVLPSLTGAYFISFISSLQEDNRIPGEIEYFPITWGVKYHAPHWDILLQIPKDNSFPSCDGAWHSQQHSALTHGESRGTGFLTTSIHLQCCMPLWGSPVWHRATGPRVDHSSVLSTLVHPAKVCCFNFFFSFTILLLAGYREDGTSIQSLLLGLMYHDP